jgi:hypothetical protein
MTHFVWMPCHQTSLASIRPSTHCGTLAGQFATLLWFYGTIATILFGTTQKGRGIIWASELYVYMWNDWWTVQEVWNQQNIGEVQSVSRHKPKTWWYKCNVDVGFHKNMGKTSVGWCVRDYIMGRFFVAESFSIHENFSIIKGEAMTLIVDKKN